MIELNVKPFYLMRHSDVNGLSGIGVVAVGCVFPNGKVVLQWTTYSTSIEIHDNIQLIIDIHGHSGATEVIFGQPPCAEPKAKSSRKKKSNGEQT